MVLASNVQACGIDGSGDACGAGAGNPINVMSGNKYQQEVDLPALPGVLGLEIVRHYNSDLSKPSISPGIIGRGWRLSYETELFVNGARIDIREADGTVRTFICDAVDIQRCDSEDRTKGAVRRPRTSGDKSTSASDAALTSNNDYLWTWNDGRVLRFNQHGKLVQIEVPTGEFVTLQYDARQLLIAVTDPQGRQLQLHYPDKAAARNSETYRGVDWIDSPVGRFRFSYGNALPKTATLFSGYLLANLARVEAPTLLPASSSSIVSTASSQSLLSERQAAANALPLGADSVQQAVNITGAAAFAAKGIKHSRMYHYEDALRPTYLTGISDAVIDSDGKITEQRFATFAYNLDGKAILSTHPNDINKVTIDYRGAGETIVTNSLGQTTAYKYAILAGQYRLLEIRGAGCALCSTPNFRYGYDTLGRRISETSLTAVGQPLYAIKTERDYFGRALKVSRIDYRNGKPQSEQLQARYEYGPGVGPTPSTIIYPSVVPGKERVKRIKLNAAGQPIALTESGWMPANLGASLVSTATQTSSQTSTSEPLLIERTTTYRYTVINGRSLLTQIDGPLPNGPSNSPADSDITTYQYDARGNFCIESISPGNRSTRAKHSSATGMLSEIENSDGINPPQRMLLSHNVQGQVMQLTRELIDTAEQSKLISLTQSVSEQLRNWVAGLFTATPKAIRRHAAVELTTRIDYTFFGEPLRVTQPDGTSIEAIYDAAHRMIGTRDQEGNASTKQFDTEHQLLVSLTHSASTSAPLDMFTRYRYDTQHRVTQITDPSQAITNYHYDSGTDQLDNVVDVLQRKTAYRYDQLGRMTAILQNAQRSDPAITKAAYFADGDQVASITAANGALTRYKVDDFGRTLQVDSPDGGNKVARYDNADRLIETQDANSNITRITYDAADRQITSTLTGRDTASQIDTHRTDYLYQGDRLISVLGRHQRDDYRYDANGRVIEKCVTLTRMPDAAISTPLLNKIPAAIMPSTDASLTGGASPTMPVTEALAGKNNRPPTPFRFITKYHYDALNRIDRTTLASGEIVQISFGKSGRPTSMHLFSADGRTIRPLVTDISMHPFNGLTQFKHGNGLTTRYDRDKATGQLTALTVMPDMPTHAATRTIPDLFAFLPAAQAAANEKPVSTVTAPFYSQHLNYDPVGRITVINRTHAGRKTVAEQYGYDELDHLNHAKSEAEDSVWTYDAVGNRQSVYATDANPEQSNFTYQTASNRLSEVNQANNKTIYYYDKVGNPITIGPNRYIYGSDGRLQQIRRDEKIIAQYAYNSAGERVAKTVFSSTGNQKTTYFLYHENKLATEFDAQGNISVQYFYIDHMPLVKLAYEPKVKNDVSGDSELVASFQKIRRWFNQSDKSIGGTIYAIHTDYLGSPRAITDELKHEVWRADYTAFGRTSIEIQNIELNLRFPGQYFDEETGTHYNYFRDYDPKSGRYMQSDPIGLEGGINTYSYAKIDPLNRIDPLGLDWIYHQSTGKITHIDVSGKITNIGYGYAGQNAGLNNPAYQGVRGVDAKSNGGPLPRGSYDIGPSHYSPNTGPNTMDLTPRKGTDTLGRNLFRIHGDNSLHNHTASHGCIVTDVIIRNKINQSNDHILQVVL